MINNVTATADQCMQFYQQPPLMDGMAMDSVVEGFMDATMLSSESMLSPRNSHNTTIASGHQLLTPKSGEILKPIRRRSRASKRTPSTLLKANTSNFRALVQQFTGCPTTTAMSFAIHKGPITLNFKQGGKQQIQHHTKLAKPMPPFGSISSNNQVHQDSVPLPCHKQPEQVPKQQLMQEQQSNSCLPSSGNSYRPISCMDDGFLFENNDFIMQELTVNAIYNDIHGLFL
ncbi:hypothetical protein Fmac_004899 [Flemingia macrophylla]|uniref:VQ domain-containing protein n=1 Tax=Flemingia macrophylla TaxID=520843 RepID=A0ABD1N681_9FABA